MRYTKPKLIQLIHIAKQKLAMDEISYRALLERVTGKTSCKQMRIVELMNVLNEMEAKGFNNRAKFIGKAHRTASPSTAKAKVKSNIAHKIRAIWIEMAKAGIIRDGSEQALNTFVRNIINPVRAQRGINILVLNVQALQDSEASIVLERLKQWQRRTQV